MLDFRTLIQLEQQRVEQAVKDANYRNFGHAAASMRKDIISTIEKAPQGVASRPGTPPNTHRRNFLTRSITYDANRDGAVLGPRKSVVGEAGAIHEFGEGNHPERAFMRPGLERNSDRFQKAWLDSIG